MYLEWGRVESAEEPLQKGWEETQATWHLDLVILVRNYLAELLMHPNYVKRDLIEADRQLTTALEESESATLHHGVIMALAGLAQLASMQ